MKIYIWDLMFGNCKKGIHRFEKFLKAYSPPPIPKRSYGIDPEQYGEIFSTKTYDVRCKHCGIKGE